VGRVDSVLTPQLHILFKDNMFWGGIGLLKSRIMGNPSLWTGFYWQASLGVRFPMSQPLDLRAGAHYLFDNWKHLGDFKTDEIELGLTLSYTY